MAGRYRVVRHSDHAVPEVAPRPLLGREGAVDIRSWTLASGGIPLLLVNASRKQGPAVVRNRFRRRVRMAFLRVLKDATPLPPGTVVWVRPPRGSRVCDIPFPVIETQLRLALSRRDPR